MQLDLTVPPDELRKKFFTIQTRQDVANLLEIDDKVLIYHLYIISDSKKYTTFGVPKKSGGIRTISAPISPLKIIQQKLNYILQLVYHPKPSVFGFVPNRNIVNNAEKHLGRKLIFNVDLKDFFPSINFGRVRGLFISKPYLLPAEAATVLAQICCYNNELPQGAPTSPIISNMICAQLDSQLKKLAERHHCYYTRYADDITFSTSLRNFPHALAFVNPLGQLEVGNELKQIINDNGFQINPDKVRLHGKSEQQEVTGIIINEKLNVRRKYIRQIRAMLHAWETFGLDNAEYQFHQKYVTKQRYPLPFAPPFKQVVKGKIEFLGMVRGKDDGLYIHFREKLRALAPELVKEPVHRLPEEGLSIPPHTKQRLRQILLSCEEFNSDIALGTLFVDTRIYPWRTKVPQAQNLEQRVDNLIDLLHDKFSVQQKSALVLFLHVLRENTSPDDALFQELGNLIDELDAILKNPT